MPRAESVCTPHLQKKSHILTRQVHAIGEKVTGVGNENDQAALDLRHAPHQGILETQRGSNSNHNADEHTAKENQQEEPASLKEVQEGQRPRLTLGIFLRRLKQDNRNGIIQDGLAKNHGIELRLDLVEVENGQDGDGVCCGEGSAHGDGLDEGDVQPVQRDTRPQIEHQAEHDSRDKGSGEGEGEDGTDVTEEVRLVQLVAGGKDDGREEEVKEELVVEGDAILEVGSGGDSNDQANEHS